MKAQCLPFRQIPHTTPLFTDFLSWTPSIQPFYSRSPHFCQWLNDESISGSYDSSRRSRVADVLERQNRAWNASPVTLENIARLRAGAAAVVTGQQVGLFGGPLFSLQGAEYGEAGARSNRRWTRLCSGFLAGHHDHDLDEISHVSVLGPDGSLHKISTSTRGLPDAPVGTVTFGDEIEPVVEAAACSARAIPR